MDAFISENALIEKIEWLRIFSFISALTGTQTTIS